MATFELTVKGVVLGGTEFFGIIGSPEIATGLLMDQYGHEVYTVSLPAERGTEQEVLIERGDPISNDSIAQLVSTTSTFKTFGLVKFDEDKTLRAKVNFKRDGETTTPRYPKRPHRTRQIPAAAALTVEEALTTGPTSRLLRTAST